MAQVRASASADAASSEAIVTFGVLARKSQTKQTSKGTNFSVWTLSDLKSGQVPLFVSGAVHAKHWKEAPGVFVGICNPSLMNVSFAHDHTTVLFRPLLVGLLLPFPDLLPA